MEGQWSPRPQVTGLVGTCVVKLCGEMLVLARSLSQGQGPGDMVPHGRGAKGLPRGTGPLDHRSTCEAECK